MVRSLQRRLVLAVLGLGLLAMLPLTGIVKAQPGGGRFRAAPGGFALRPARPAAASFLFRTTMVIKVIKANQGNIGNQA